MGFGTEQGLSCKPQATYALLCMPLPFPRHYRNPLPGPCVSFARCLAQTDNDGNRGSLLYEERLERAERRRLTGNELFKAGQYKEALAKYAMVSVRPARARRGPAGEAGAGRGGGRRQPAGGRQGAGRAGGALVAYADAFSHNHRLPPPTLRLRLHYSNNHECNPTHSIKASPPTTPHRLCPTWMRTLCSSWRATTWTRPRT